MPPSDIEPPINCPSCYGRPRGLCPNCGTIGPEDIGPPFNTPLATAIGEMGRALHALRLEVPGPVADDITARWRKLLDAIATAVTDDRIEPPFISADDLQRCIVCGPVGGQYPQRRIVVRFTNRWGERVVELDCGHLAAARA